MKLTGRFALCTAILLTGMPLRAQAPSILESPVERLEGPPLWISAAAVADEQKIIDLDLLDDHFLRGHVEKQLRDLRGRRTAESSTASKKPSVVTIPLSECKRSLYSTGQDHRGGMGSTSTLSALAANSQSILRGTISTIDLGFDRGIPASLLGIEVSETIKGTAPAPVVYVLYPVARFRIGPLSFCNARQGFEPRPGDQLLLFDYTGTVDRNHVLFAPHLNQIVFQSQGGALLLPSELRNTPGMDTIRTLDDVVGRLGSSPSPRGGAR